MNILLMAQFKKINFFIIFLMNVYESASHKLATPLKDLALNFQNISPKPQINNKNKEQK